MEDKNVFEDTVKTLTNDAISLQKKFHKLQESNDIRASIDVLRLLKDTLLLIREYDWKLMYSESESNGHKEVAVWEENGCGNIKNHKIWKICDEADLFYNRWIEEFEKYILQRRSNIEILYRNYDFRGSGKSYAITKLCDKYNGVIIVKDKLSQALGVKNNCNMYRLNAPIIRYSDSYSQQLKDKIFFVDETSGLSEEELNKLCESHVTIGFFNTDLSELIE